MSRRTDPLSEDQKPKTADEQLEAALKAAAESKARPGAGASEVIQERHLRGRALFLARQEKPKPRRKPGRPVGSLTIPKDALIARYRELKRNYGRAPSQPQLAANLKPPIATRTLQDHLTAYALPWPIE